jgi:hypothetical protein
MDKITRTNTLNTKSVAQSLLKYPPKIRPPSPWYNVGEPSRHDYNFVDI